MFQTLKAFYQGNARFRLVVQAVEGGAALGFVTATANGFDFSKKGLQALGVAAGSGALVAIRNLIINWQAIKENK